MTREALEVRINGERLAVSSATLEKYNQPGPRYTSYPTAPEWDDSFGPDDARASFRQANRKASPAPVSLYFHIPFCQSLCLYCGCNVVISKKHEVATPYLDHLKREINSVSAEILPTRKVEQLHWGGGTPTFLSAGQIEELYGYIARRFTFSPDAEISAEIDPRATTMEQLEVMRRSGFNRVSLGVQDFDPLVQKTIHRVQPYETTKEMFDYCRELGYASINVDLIYGLPHQTAESFSDTLEKIITMNPARIAVFSYAHVPWMKRQQGSFANFLPEGLEKFRIFSRANRDVDHRRVSLYRAGPLRPAG
jgi:oxygen-independent coproporphyrinogen III oxidase